MGATGSVVHNSTIFTKVAQEYQRLKDSHASDEQQFEQLKSICMEFSSKPGSSNCATLKTVNLQPPSTTSDDVDLVQMTTPATVITNGPNSGCRRSRRPSMEISSSSSSSKTKRLNIFSKGLDVEKRHDVTPVSESKKDEKSDECVALLKRALETLLFEENGEHEVELVIAVMAKVTVKPGENVIVQGDHGDKFYVVEHGSLDFVVNENVVGSVQGGGHFGELALIYDAPRAATVRAKENSVLWTLGRDDFRMIQAQTSSDSLVKRAKWLQNVPILARLSPRQLSLLAAALEAVIYQNAEAIIRQGEAGDAFYIVEEGTVECHVNDQIALLTEGEYFGEMALLNDKPRNASILARGAVKCLKLGRREFDSMIGPLATLLASNSTKRILRMFSRFQHLGEDELEMIVGAFEEVDFTDGDVIFSSGEAEAEAFYILKEGAVSIVDNKSDSTTDALMLQPGDHFGSEMVQGDTAVAYRSRATASGSVQCMKLTQQGMVLANDKYKSGELPLDGTEAAKQKRHELVDINFKDLFQIGVLGEGSFGKVSMVQAFVNDREYTLALKAMSKSHIVECFQVNHVMREKEILFNLPPHPFIVRLYTTGQNQNFLFMLMELVQGGELLSVLHNDEEEDELDEDSIRFYAANIYLALEHLHKRDIAYRDLKPENLLFAENGYLKLVDFGFAKQIPFTVTNEHGVEDTHSRSYTLCGTQEYLAPEYVLNTGHDLAVDYWALGVLIYEMILGYTPFETEDGDISMLFKNIAFVRTGANRVNFPEELEECQPEACDFIRQLLNGDPNKRIGVGINGPSEIRNHPYFRSISWTDLEQQQTSPPHVPELSGRYDISCFEGDQGIRSNDEPFHIDDLVFEGF